MGLQLSRAWHPKAATPPGHPGRYEATLPGLAPEARSTARPPGRLSCAPACLRPGKTRRRCMGLQLSRAWHPKAATPPGHPGRYEATLPGLAPEARSTARPPGRLSFPAKIHKITPSCY
jgi:hypothetical protein